MPLTQKETMLLQDLKSQEQLCVEKYANYAQAACDEPLKQLFDQLGQQEQQHLDTLTQMLGSSASSQTSGKQSKPQPQPFAKQGEECDPRVAQSRDAYLCQDALDTEKHVAASYNTDIFEMVEAQQRNALNHIQKEEQEHGKKIYDYMAAHNMY